MKLAARSSPKPVPRRRRCRRRTASLVSVLALLAAFGCTDSPSPATPAGQADQWAAAAEAYLRVPALGTRPDFVAAMADVVRRGLAGQGLTA
jgi:hypothetical protein